MSFETLKGKIEQLIDKSKNSNSYFKIINCLNINFKTVSDDKKNLIEHIPTIDNANQTSFSDCFYGMKNLKKIESLNTSNATRFDWMFALCSSLIEAPYLDTSKGDDFRYMFHNCYALERINNLDISNANSNLKLLYMFLGCTSLVTVSFVPQSIKWSISFSFSPLLSDESIQSIIDGLATVETAQTLTLHEDVKAKLTDEQIAQITSKNWSLA